MYRCEIVTPAGRKPYLEILYKYLKAQKSAFDSWQLWVNTTNQTDIDYMKQLAAENNWIQLIIPTWKVDGIRSIYRFFQNTKRDDTIYIRLDDDVVYLAPNFIEEMKQARIDNPSYFLVYSNIINNAIISYIHHRNGLISGTMPGYNCLDNIGWKDPKYCENLHRLFLNDLEKNDISKWRSSFSKWVCYEFERVSINCISWFGSYFNRYISSVGMDEEEWLACTYPRKANKPNLIVSGPICAHYSFFTQRPHMDTTDILQKYAEIADKL